MGSKNQQISETKLDGAYAKYVLAVLFLISIVNIADRSLITILAEEIKRDLQLSDGQLGFLSGTAFFVFYCTMGLAIARLADVWSRVKLISISVGVWSTLTSLSSLANSFTTLALCRLGVAAGESGVSPASYSLIYDYFSPKRRTMAIAIFICSISIGGGGGLIVGGWLLSWWQTTWPEAMSAPLGLSGWQATFLLFGLPGIAISIWASTLIEPQRNQTQRSGTEQVQEHPFRDSLAILVSMVPVANLLGLQRSSHSLKPVVNNLLVGVTVIALAFLLIASTGDVAQWAVLGFGIYALFSWSQGISQRDPAVFGMIFKSKALGYVILAFCGFSVLTMAIPFWSVPYIQRYYGINAEEVGTVLGIGGPIVGIAGLLMGGMFADKLNSKTQKGKLYVWLFGLLGALISVFCFVLSKQSAAAYAGLLSTYFFMSIASAPLLSSVNDLVLPRGRATTTSFVFAVSGLTGSAIVPYLVGLMSDSLHASGIESGEALRQAMLLCLALPTLSIIPTLFALRHVEHDLNSIPERAKAFGDSYD